MRLFQIDYKRLILLLLPTFLRKKRIVAFLHASTVPVASLHNKYLTNRDNNLYRLRMSGQVCYLRRLLNNAFPDANNRIRIDDGEKTGEFQFVWDANFDPYQKYLLISTTPALFWDRNTIIEGAGNFTVYAPQIIFNANNDAKIRSLLNMYKLLSKSYTIIYE